MDLLILLVREKGRLISREEIIERLWGKNLYFDTDNSINTAIRKIRNASATTPGIRSMSRPCWERDIASRGRRSLPLLWSRRRSSGHASCSQFFRLKI